MTKTDGSPFTISEVIEMMQEAIEHRRIDMGTGGMRVPYHGPLCGATPSVLKDVQKWADMLSYTVDKMEQLI